MRFSISRILTMGALAAGLVGLCGTVHAATVTFTTTSASGSNGSLDNTRTFTDAGSGLVLTTKAYTYGTDFNDAYLGIYSHGLGVCEGGTSCNDPLHQVDDSSGKDEWVLFSFSAAVDPTSVHVYSTSGSDTDAAYFWGSSALTDLTPGGDGTGAADKQYADLGSMTTNSGSVSQRDVALTIPSSPGARWLLFGVPTSNPDANTDKFKITSITVETPSTEQHDLPVPEPTSLLLLGTGLVGLGGRMRRYFS